jgi:hypothetical protein
VLNVPAVSSFFNPKTAILHNVLTVSAVGFPPHAAFLTLVDTEDRALRVAGWCQEPRNVTLVSGGCCVSAGDVQKGGNGVASNIADRLRMAVGGNVM